MTSRSIYSIYIADGFVDDCDELVHKCSQVSTLSYEKFCHIWKEMNFGAIFHGRGSTAELIELSEEVLLIAKRYMVTHHINFEETVAGLFLVYGLLNIQPFSNFAPVRFIADDVAAMKHIEFQARKYKRQDVLYILGSVLIRGPCHYHVSERERGIEYPIRKYLEGMTSIDKQGVRSKGVFCRQNDELDIIRDMVKINTMYKAAKSRLASDKSLKYVDENLITELESSLKKIIIGVLDDDDDKEKDDKKEERSSNVDIVSLKQRAMMSAVDSIRHRVGVNERKTIQKNSEMKESQTSPKKQGAENSKKRSKNYPRQCRKRRKKSREIVSDNSSDDDELVILSDDSGDNRNEQVVQLNNNMDLVIQSLPIIDHCNEKGYEIEFIDYLNTDSTNNKEQNTDSTSKINNTDSKANKKQSTDNLNTNSASKIQNLNSKNNKMQNTDSTSIIRNTDSTSKIQNSNSTNEEIRNTDNLSTDSTCQIQNRDSTNNEIRNTDSICKIQNSVSTNNEIRSTNDLNTDSTNTDNTYTETNVRTEKNQKEDNSEITKYIDNDNFKRPFLDSVIMRRLERRNLKRPRLKTKFQRMGLLPVANFVEKKS